MQVFNFQKSKSGLARAKVCRWMRPGGLKLNSAKCLCSVGKDIVSIIDKRRDSIHVLPDFLLQNLNIFLISQRIFTNIGETMYNSTVHKTWINFLIFCFVNIFWCKSHLVLCNETICAEIYSKSSTILLVTVQWSQDSLAWKSNRWLSSLRRSVSDTYSKSSLGNFVSDKNMAKQFWSYFRFYWT